MTWIFSLPTAEAIRETIMGTLKFAAQEGRSARTLAFRGASMTPRPVSGTTEPRSGWESPASPAIRPAATPTERPSGTIAQPIPRGNRLPLCGASNDPVTVVQSGSVALFKALPGNRSICIGILGPGDLVFHDCSVAGDEVVAEALTDAVVLQEEFQRLVTVLSGSPPLVQAALISLRRQSTEMQGLVSRVLSRDIALRLAAMLLALSDRFGRPNSDGTIAIGIPVAHKMLARMIGSNRVTVTRVMTEMRDHEMVRAPGRNQIVVDVPRLRNYLAGSQRGETWLAAD
jgi:CRP-like cAMP-binding protein